MAKRRLVLLVVSALVAGAVWWTGLFAASDPNSDRPEEALAIGAQDEVERERRAGVRDSETANAGGAPVREGKDGTDGAAVTVFGRVLREDGRPVAAARIRWSVGGPSARQEEDLQKVGPLPAVAAELRGRREVGRAISASDGRFRARLRVAAADVQMRVRARGCRRHRRDVRVQPGAAIDLGDIALGACVVVSGQVLDARGKGVAGARVRTADAKRSRMLPRAAFRSQGVLVDSSGRFEIELARPGDFRLVAMHAAHPDGEFASRAETLGEEVEGVVIRLADGATVEGIAVGVPASSDTRVVACRVQTAEIGVMESIRRAVRTQIGLDAERSTRIDADGSFSIGGLDAKASYELCLAQGEHVFDLTPCSERVRSRANAKGVRLVFQEGLVITLRVVDAATEKPVTGYELEAGIERMLDFAGSKRPYTRTRKVPLMPDADGRTAIVGIRPDKDGAKLVLRIQASGFESFERQFEVPRAGEVDLGVLRLVRAARVDVAVVDPDDAPVVGALVKLVRVSDAVASGRSARSERRRRGAAAWQNGVKTDERGRCTVFGVAGQRFELAVLAVQGFAEYRGEPFLLARNEVAERRVRLTVGGTVVVHVLDPAGKPSVGARVERRRGDVTPPPQPTGKDGQTVFVRLPPGKHEFRIEPSGLDRRADKVEWQVVQVVDGKTARVELRQAARATVSGVVMQNGKPLAGATVRFVSGPGDGTEGESNNAFEGLFGGGVRFGDPPGTARVGRDGRYALADLPVGSHRLRVSHPELPAARTFPVTLAMGANRSDLNVLSAAIAGRVTNGSNEPIAGARVAVGSPDESDQLVAVAHERIARLLGAPDKSIRTDARGRYRIAGVPVGKAIVVRAFEEESVTAKSRTLRLQAGQTIEDLDLRLTPGGTLRVQLFGAPSGGTVVATWLDDPASGVERRGVVQNGSLILKGMQGGKWKVELELPAGAERPSKTVRVEPGKIVRVELRR